MRKSGHLEAAREDYNYLAGKCDPSREHVLILCSNIHSLHIQGQRTRATKKVLSGNSQIQIFWPKLKSLCSSPGDQAILGWIREGGPGELVAVVAGVFPLPVDPDLLLNLESIQPQGQEASSSLAPRILGECLRPNLHYETTQKKSSTGDLKGKGRDEQAELIQASSDDLMCLQRSSSDFWITATLPAVPKISWWGKSSNSRVPSLKGLRIPSRLSATLQRSRIFSSQRSAAASHSISVILYDTPKPDILQYLSLDPLQLSPSPESEPEISIGFDNDSSGARIKQAEMTPLQRKLEQSIALDPERWFEVTGGYKDFGPGSGLRKAVGLMNESKLLMRRLEQPKLPDQSVGVERGRLKATPSLPLHTVLRFLKLAQNALRFPVIYMRGKQYSLLDVSAAARQLDARLVQLQLWPVRAARLRRLRKGRLAPVSSLSSQYIGVWNGIWLVANDLILGYAIGWTLKNKRLQIANFMTFWILRITNDWVIDILAWLGDWPAGLKLNTELALFFGDMYQGMTEVWVKEGLSLILPILPTLIYSIGLAGQLLGFTMTISLIIDSLNVLTLHLTGFYSIGRTVYIFFLYVLDSLFNLFRGKKRNPLRNGRIDDATYELDQLLLGTIFFTLLTFLFPTVFVYYLAFASYRLLIVIASIALEFVKDFLNHLPLFAIMLRFKDPSRLPSGIELRSIIDPAPSNFELDEQLQQMNVPPARKNLEDVRESCEEEDEEGVGSIQSQANHETKTRLKEARGDDSKSAKLSRPVPQKRRCGASILFSSETGATTEHGPESEMGVVIEDDEELDRRGSRGDMTVSTQFCTCSRWEASYLYPSRSSPSSSIDPTSASILPVTMFEILSVPLGVPSLFSGYSIRGISSIPKLVSKVVTGAFF